MQQGSRARCKNFVASWASMLDKWRRIVVEAWRESRPATSGRLNVSKTSGAHKNAENVTTLHALLQSNPSKIENKVHPKFLLTVPRDITGDELERLKDEIRTAFQSRRHIQLMRADDLQWTIESPAIPEEGRDDESLQAD